jgi:drug/metabolite transporter (DMT)-like permease
VLVSQGGLEGEMKSVSPLMFFLKNAVISLLASACFIGLLLVTNTGDLRTHLFHSDEAWLLLFILVFFMGITFSLIQFGLAIYLGSEDPREGE